MSKIAARAKLNRGLKTYGKLTDRFFIERDTDGVSFVGNDAGSVYVKTISSTSDWLNVTFNYKNPIPQMKISAEIV